MIENLPIAGQPVHHHSGRMYVIMHTTNADAADPEKYPVTIVYREVDSDRVWSRPWSEFKHKFSVLKNGSRVRITTDKSLLGGKTQHMGCEGRIVDPDADSFDVTDVLYVEINKIQYLFPRKSLVPVD